MRITREDLIAKGASCSGLEEFDCLFPDGIDVPYWSRWCQTVILGTELRRHLGWAAAVGIIPMWSMSGADLSRADLSEANLYGAILYGADLSRANLSEANLYGANLYGADLSRADLSEANLYGANLSMANLSRADLSRADLSRADLSGANRLEDDLPIHGWIVRNGRMKREGGVK